MSSSFIRESSDKSQLRVISNKKLSSQRHTQNDGIKKHSITVTAGGVVAGLPLKQTRERNELAVMQIVSEDNNQGRDLVRDREPLIAHRPPAKKHPKLVVDPPNSTLITNSLLTNITITRPAPGEICGLVALVRCLHGAVTLGTTIAHYSLCEIT